MSLGKYITDLEQEVKSLREEVDILTKQHAILMDRLGSWWRCPRVQRTTISKEKLKEADDLIRSSNQPEYLQY